jgi:hypothetical protein
MARASQEWSGPSWTDLMGRGGFCGFVVAEFQIRREADGTGKFSRLTSTEASVISLGERIAGVSL